MSRRVNIGPLAIGGGRIAIQSMTNTDTRDIPATAAQISALAQAGCDIVRVSVYDEECARAIKKLKKTAQVPLVADIHFDHRLALQSIENGIDKLRINPGNIGSEQKVAELVSACKDRCIPIRIGVNAGSLEKQILEKYGRSAEAMVESALGHVAILERHGFYQTVISVKHSDVRKNVKAYRMLADRTDYPLHLGVTEAGTERMAIIKSSIGIGSLLLDGIGDTLRVSIAGDPLREVAAGQDILRACGLLHQGVDIIACPTCGRTGIDVEAIANEVERRVAHIKAPVKAAVMGCVVNGPGEAAMADVGIAGGKTGTILFRRGERVRNIDASEAVDILVEEIEAIAGAVSDTGKAE